MIYLCESCYFSLIDSKVFLYNKAVDAVLHVLCRLSTFSCYLHRPHVLLKQTKTLTVVRRCLLCCSCYDVAHNFMTVNTENCCILWTSDHIMTVIVGVIITSLFVVVVIVREDWNVEQIVVQSTAGIHRYAFCSRDLDLILRSSGQGQGSTKHVFVSCVLVVCFRLKGNGSLDKNGLSLVLTPVLAPNYVN